MNKKLNLESLIFLAVNSAKEAGLEIMNVYRTDDFKVQLKKDESPLTIADKKSNDIICKKLKLTNIPILSEEGTEIKYTDRKKWQYFWLIDPLDGTKEFIKKNDEFTVNIALINANKTIAGVVYVPVKDEMFFGIVNESAYKSNNFSKSNYTSYHNLCNNAEKLPLNKNKDKDKIVVVGSRSHMNEETKSYIHSLTKSYSQIEIISKGSSLKICVLAESTADLYPRMAPTMEWDTAAAHAILKAAGGNIFNIENYKELKYNKENLLNPYFLAKSNQHNS